MTHQFRFGVSPFSPTATEHWLGPGNDFIPLRHLSQNNYKFFLYKSAERVGVWRNDKQTPHEFATWGLPWRNPIPRDPNMVVVGYAPGAEPYVYISQVAGGGTTYRVWSRHLRVTVLRPVPRPGTGFSHTGETWISWQPEEGQGTTWCPYTWPPTPNRPTRRRIQLARPEESPEIPNSQIDAAYAECSQRNLF